MAKGKSVVKGLIDSAESAFFSAIEMHTAIQRQHY